MKNSFSQKEPLNFLGLRKQNKKKAKFWVLPVPLETTVFNLGGTKEGPLAIILASRAIELFDEDLKKEIKEEDFFTLPFLDFSKNSTKEAILDIQKAVFEILKNKKFPVILGGEHTITLGAVLAFKKLFGKKFSVLQFDAHCDLRNEFEGTKYSHATFARRIVEDLKIKICQLGIRSFSKEEFDFFKNSKLVKVFFKKDYNLKEISNFLEQHIYLTIDLDCFDPSIMPAVGTPEPEGFLFEEILNLIKEILKNKKIIGLDCVELCPIPGLFAPNYLASKLIFKILNLLT